MNPKYGPLPIINMMQAVICLQHAHIHASCVRSSSINYIPASS